MTERAEIEQVIAWLRGPVWERLGIMRRMHFAIGMLFMPDRVASAFFRFAADLIERGEHKEKTDV